MTQVFTLDGGLDGWSLPAILEARAESNAVDHAFRYQRAGRFHDVTWAELHRQVEIAASHLRSLGVKRGDRVGVMAGAHPLAVTIEHAVWANGAISVGIYPTSSVQDIDHFIRHTEPVVIAAQGADEIARLRQTGLKLGPLLVLDPAGLNDTDGLQSLPSILATGAAPPWSPIRADPESPISITFTSGTTGTPKGVVHTHRSALYTADSKRWMVPALVHSPQRTFTSVPFTHISPKTSAILLPLVSRLVPHFAESMTTVREALREARPTYLVQPPRFYEKLAGDLLAIVAARPEAERVAYDEAMVLARQVAEQRWTGEPVPIRLADSYERAKAEIFDPLLRLVGYDALRYAYVGSAPANANVIGLWQCWGLDLRESYGLTETGASVLAQQEPFPEPGNLGGPLQRDDFMIQIAGDGELLFKAPSNFAGYWNAPEETAKVLVDGWLKSGDLVSVDQRGRIRLEGRKNSAITTSAGKTLNPEKIEAVLKTSPFVLDALVVGHGKAFVSALLEIDSARVSEWAKQNGHAVGCYTDMAANPAVRDLIGGEVARANEMLGRFEQIRRFALVPKPFGDIPGAHSAQMKLRRGPALEAFSELVNQFYSEASNVRQRVE